MVTSINQPEKPQHGCELFLNGPSSYNCIPVQPTTECVRGHWLSVAGPVTFERPKSCPSFHGAARIAPGQMTQQHRLEARALPDDMDFMISCEPRCLLPSSWITLSLVRIQENEPCDEITAVRSLPLDLLHRSLDARERVASTTTQIDCEEIRSQAGFIEEGLKQGRITNFRTPLATHKDAGPLINMGPPTSHPI
ncbi:hypothetical protein ACLBXM_00260 [Xanthobacteraceae bacterium A53D]